VSSGVAASASRLQRRCVRELSVSVNSTTETPFIQTGGEQRATRAADTRFPPLGAFSPHMPLNIVFDLTALRGMGHQKKGKALSRSERQADFSEGEVHVKKNAEEVKEKWKNTSVSVTTCTSNECEAL